MHVIYEENSDSPTAGSHRADCMAEVLFDMTRHDFRAIPMCLAEDFFAALYLALIAVLVWAYRRGV